MADHLKLANDPKQQAVKELIGAITQCKKAGIDIRVSRLWSGGSSIPILVIVSGAEIVDGKLVVNT